MQAKVFIIIINYNNWIDTLECLESVFRVDYDNYKVILVDNNSNDDSVDKILQWLHGELNIWTPPDNPLRNLSYPPLDKPLDFCLLDQTTIKQPLDKKQFVISSRIGKNNHKSKIFFILSKRNLGFAGANNLGIYFAELEKDYEYIWLLNNDTVIKSDTLYKLVEKSKTDPNLGICGSSLFFYHSPQKIQALGSSLNSWLGVTHHITKKKDLHKLRVMVGASFLISKKCIEKIGYFPEEYFLYREETDYCLNAKKNNILITVAINSIVYHKVGKSSDKHIKDYYTSRNSLYLMKKHFPKQIVTIYIYLHFRMIFSKILLLQPKRLIPTLLGIKDFWMGRMGKLR